MADFLQAALPPNNEALNSGDDRLRAMKRILNRGLSQIFSELTASSHVMLPKWITGSMLADASVGSQHLQDGAVVTRVLADGALSADEAGRAKMADGFVTFGKLAASLPGEFPAKAALVTADRMLIADSEAGDVAKVASPDGITLTYASITDWVKFSIPSGGGTPTVLGKSAGISAVSWPSIGNYTINFSPARSSTDYLVFVTTDLAAATPEAYWYHGAQYILREKHTTSFGLVNSWYPEAGAEILANTAVMAVIVG